MVRTPLRIGLMGGGTDLPFFYKNHGTAELITITPKLYIDVWVRKRRTDDIGINDNIYEMADDIPDPRLRLAFRYTGVTKGTYLFIASDVPTGGTGLGSSAAMLVGVLNALSQFRGESVSPTWLAETASAIEMNDLKLSSGKQDAYASAFGGLNALRISREGKTDVNRIYLPFHENVWNILNTYFLMFWTGIRRDSESVLSQVKECQRTEILYGIRDLAKKFRDELHFPGRKIGEMLHTSWLLKKQMAPNVSTPDIDAIYDTARDAGAIGGKLLGAGGGGFFLFYAAPTKHKKIREALSHLQEFPIEFTDKGTHTLLCDL